MMKSENDIIEALDRIDKYAEDLRKEYDLSIKKNQQYEELINLIMENIEPEKPILLNIKVKLQEIRELKNVTN